MNQDKIQARIEKAVKDKQVRIDKAINNKELSIAYFNSLNAAIELTKDWDYATKEEQQSTVLDWRDFFLKEWQKWYVKQLTPAVDMTKYREEIKKFAKTGDSPVKKEEEQDKYIAGSKIDDINLQLQREADLIKENQPSQDDK